MLACATFLLPAALCIALIVYDNQIPLSLNQVRTFVIPIAWLLASGFVATFIAGRFARSTISVLYIGMGYPTAMAIAMAVMPRGFFLQQIPDFINRLIAPAKLEITTTVPFGLTLMSLAALIPVWYFWRFWIEPDSRSRWLLILVLAQFIGPILLAVTIPGNLGLSWIYAQTGAVSLPLLLHAALSPTFLFSTFGRCPMCNYDLKGIIADHCPECGRQIIHPP
jgi:hypothetical protein